MRYLADATKAIIMIDFQANSPSRISHVARSNPVHTATLARPKKFAGLEQIWYNANGHPSACCTHLRNVRMSASAVPIPESSHPSSEQQEKQ
jgi:hypothetical protein